MLFQIAITSCLACGVNLTSVKSAAQIIHKHSLESVPAASSPSIEELESQRAFLSLAVARILDNPKTLDAILAVKNGLYSDDGLIFKRIIFGALKDKPGRSQFIAGLKYDKCKKWFWECPVPPITLDMLRFKFKTNLKGQIDALENQLIALGILADTDLSDLNPDDFDRYESYFALAHDFEPILGELVSTLFDYYSGISLENLSRDELKSLFGKLSLFLDDKETGALAFVRKAMPRT